MNKSTREPNAHPRRPGSGPMIRDRRDWNGAAPSTLGNATKRQAYPNTSLCRHCYMIHESVLTIRNDADMLRPVPQPRRPHPTPSKGGNERQPFVIYSTYCLVECSLNEPACVRSTAPPPWSTAPKGMHRVATAPLQFRASSKKYKKCTFRNYGTPVRTEISNDPSARPQTAFAL